MKSNTLEQFFDIQSSTDIELKRKKFVLYFASYIGALIILIFAFKNYDSSNNTLSLVLLSSAFFIVSNAFISHFTNQFQISCYIGCFCIAALMLQLLISGGYENTALYWMYPFPLVFFALLNYKVGLIFNLILWFFLTFILYNPELLIAQYRDTELARFSASLLITILIGFLSEYYRFRSHKELSDINVEKQHQANTDALTGLPNRRFIESCYIKHLLEQKNTQMPLTLVMVDIDHFKNVNDTYGHDIGDEVLCFIAYQLKNNLRKSDVAVRIGGEEFLLLIPQTNIKNSIKLTNKIRLLIEKNTFYQGEISINITASFGISLCSEVHELNTAIKHADQQLYKAKESGRNCIRYQKDKIKQVTD